MAKSPSIRLVIECLLVAVLGFAIWQLYFKADKKQPQQHADEPGRALKSARFIKDKAKFEGTPSRPVPVPVRTTGPVAAESAPVKPDEPPIEETGYLAGVVVDEDGNPVAGPVNVSDAAETFSLDIDNGTFREALPPGRYIVTARGRDDDTAAVPVVAEVKNGETQSIQLILPTLRRGEIGLEFQKRAEWIEVLAVWNGGPAQLAGIQPGDLIIEIGGSPVEQLSPSAIAELLAGPAGSQVEVVMAVAEGNGWVDVPVTLTRAMLNP